VCPVLADIGHLGLDRFDALFLASALGHGEGIFMLTGEIFTGIDHAIRTGKLVGQSQVNAEVDLSNGFCSVSNRALEIDVPATARVLGEAARLDRAFDRPRQPQPKPLATVRDRVALELDIRSFKRYPPTRAFATTPLELDLLKLTSLGDILRTDLLKGVALLEQWLRGRL
jgi:hypothetical protein